MTRHNSRKKWSGPEVMALIQYVREHGPPRGAHKGKDLWAQFSTSCSITSALKRTGVRLPIDPCTLLLSQSTSACCQPLVVPAVCRINVNYDDHYRWAVEIVQVDVKDKWRNLLKAKKARAPNAEEREAHLVMDHFRQQAAKDTTVAVVDQPSPSATSEEFVSGDTAAQPQIEAAPAGEGT